MNDLYNTKNTMNSDKRYKRVKNFFSDDISKITTQYALFNMLSDFQAIDSQVPESHSKYADNLMETLLLFAKPKMEYETGKELIPTYSYFRVYKPGDDLPMHSDREACEISATVTLGYKYVGKPPDFKWPIGFLESGKPDSRGCINGETKWLSCDTGDAIIYKGCEIPHCRETLTCEEGSFHVQVFLHYIDKNGPYYPKFANDQRPCIGIKR